MAMVRRALPQCNYCCAAAAQSCSPGGSYLLKIGFIL